MKIKIDDTFFIKSRKQLVISIRDGDLVEAKMSITVGTKLKLIPPSEDIEPISTHVVGIELFNNNFGKLCDIGLHVHGFEEKCEFRGWELTIE